jgi:hypothetical protein
MSKIEDRPSLTAPCCWCGKRFSKRSGVFVFLFPEGWKSFHSAKCLREWIDINEMHKKRFARRKA